MNRSTFFHGILSVPFVLVFVALLVPQTAGAEEIWAASNHIRVFDLETGTPIAVMPLERHIRDIQFNNEGTLAFVGASNGLHIADVRQHRLIEHSFEGSQVLALDAHGDVLVMLTWPDKSSRAQSDDTAPNSLGSVSFLKRSTGSLIRQFVIPGRPLDVLMSPDGLGAVVADQNGHTLRYFNLEGTNLWSIDVIQADKNSASSLERRGTTIVFATLHQDESLLHRIDWNGSRVGDPIRVPGGQRIRVLAGSSATNDLWLMSMDTLYRLNSRDVLEGATNFDITYTHASQIPGSQLLILSAITFDSEKNAGGLSVVSHRGEVLRSVVLPSMSPYFTVVYP